MTREEWLRERMSGLGASDVPIVLGLSPWKDPYTLWAEKTGQVVADDQESIPMRWGHACEDALARMFTDDTGIVVTDPGDYALTRHPEYPWLRCTPDRLAPDGCPVELKCVSSMKRNDWKDSAPLMYQAQVQAQMCVLGKERGWLCAMIGNTDLFIQEQQYNKRFMDAALVKLAEFWKRVEDKTPPPVESSTDIRTWERLNASDGTTTELPEELLATCERYESLKAEQGALEEERKELEQALKLSIGTSDFGCCGPYRYSYKTQSRAGAVRVSLEHLDALKDAHIPHKVTDGTSYRVLRTAKSKES